VAGAIGGLVGAWTMNQFQVWLSELAKDSGQKNADPATRKRLGASATDRPEDDSKKSSGDDATVKTANAISEKVFDHKLSKFEKKLAGPAVHYAFGSSMGGMYGLAVELQPGVTAGNGLAFGAALWLAADEVVVPALGIGRPPVETPPETHAYALLSHFVYGLTTELVRRSVRRML
jgi:putative membrane protein